MQKILVVDDERDICEFVKAFFQDRGFEVYVAQSGDEALAITRREKPEIVLLDIKMQGMDGIATLKHLKTIDKNLKVIMVTALEDRDKMEEACRLGASEYITKPLALDHLEETVERTLKG